MSIYVYHEIIVFAHHYLNCVHLKPIEANVSLYWNRHHNISKLVWLPDSGICKCACEIISCVVYAIDIII